MLEIGKKLQQLLRRWIALHSMCERSLMDVINFLGNSMQGSLKIWRTHNGSVDSGLERDDKCDTMAAATNLGTDVGVEIS